MGRWDSFWKPWRAASHQPPKVQQFASAELASAPLTSAFKNVSDSGDWQRKAWTFYDLVPEVRLVVGYRAAALSKVKLYLAVVDGQEEEVLDTPAANNLLDTLFGGLENQGNSLSRLAQHLTIVGETYNLLYEKDNRQFWFIVPPDHMDFTGYSSVVEGGQLVHKGRLGFENPLTGEKETINFSDGQIRFNTLRIWQPHPHKFWEADSPTRGGVPTLERISHYDAVEKGAAASRLTGGGVWFLPQEMSFPTPRDNLTKEDTFRQNFFEAMNTARQNPDSAAAVSPLMVWAPGELLDKIKDPYTFWSEWNAAVTDLRDKEIRRYASGQPLPTEKITGISDTNHWTGWQLSEEDLKFDISPLANLICDSLTPWIVQPLLGDNVFLRPDLTELVTRPNRTPEAINLFQAGVITRKEARVSSGYAPEPEGNPDYIDGEVVSSELTTSQTQSPPEQPEPEAAFAVAEMVAKDILTSAGKWLLTHTGREQRRKLQTVEASNRHLHIEADPQVVFSAADSVKQKYGSTVSPRVVQFACRYVADLYKNRQPFTRSQFRSALVGDGDRK